MKKLTKIILISAIFISVLALTIKNFKVEKATALADEEPVCCVDEGCCNGQIPVYILKGATCTAKKIKKQ